MYIHIYIYIYILTNQCTNILYEHILLGIIADNFPHGKTYAALPSRFREAHSSSQPLSPTPEKMEETILDSLGGSSLKI